MSENNKQRNRRGPNKTHPFIRRRKKSVAKKSTTKRAASRSARVNHGGSVLSRLLSLVNYVFAKVNQLLRRRFVLISLLILLVISVIYVVYLDIEVRSRFEGRLWSVPSKVYARPLQLITGMKLNPKQLEAELKLLAYEQVVNIPQRAGQYRRWENVFELISREFKDSDRLTPSYSLRLEINDNILTRLEHLYLPDEIDQARLDPALIGSIYPKSGEDRQLLKLEEVPDRLIKTLIAVEDRSFFQHWGVNPLAIARALVVNLKAGEKRQGGSTLTQQLVKNLFLSSERSYWRKINEAIMALLLELHYDKASILEAYLNEVYIGQNGKSSINGLELGSQFYYNKPLNKLTTEQGALLIGLIKGPSYFNPRRHPKRALQRRNVVLDVMLEQGVISELHYKKMKSRPLSVVDQTQLVGGQYPAFIDLVKRQLRSRFSTQDLKQEGLQIFTTLDPQVQLVTESSVQKMLTQIEHRAHDVPLQTAVIISDIETAEVMAMIGGRDASYRGFNRALDASRQIGSLIKPAVYLAALDTAGEGPDAISLATPLEDTPLALKFRNGTVWQPQNYDREFRGQVILFDALVQSYNVPTVRLGLKIGLEHIVTTLRNLGLQKEVPVYPSMLLGAFELSPFEVASMYQGIADDGRQLGLHAIRTVLSHDGEPLVYFAEEKQYTINENTVFLLKTALHEVTQSGTAKRLHDMPVAVAGKTGTTDDLRDSWFAGFSGDKLGVVWVGNDENLEIGLTGSSGALPVWQTIFSQLSVEPLDLSSPENASYKWVDRKSGKLAGFGCNNAVKLPFLDDRRPDQYASCD